MKKGEIWGKNPTTLKETVEEKEEGTDVTGQ